MRVAIGSALFIQGEYYAREPGALPTAWAMGLAAMLAAGLLLIGYLTPFVASAVVLGGIGIWLSLLAACTPTLFDSDTSAVFGLTILTALITLGPGAFSVDARMFGRREIILPPVRSTKERATR